MILRIMLGIVHFFISFRYLMKLMEEKEEFEIPHKIVDLTFQLNYKLVVQTAIETFSGKKMTSLDINDDTVVDVARQYNIYYLYKCGVNALWGVLFINITHPIALMLIVIGVICSSIFGVHLKHNLYVFIRDLI